MNTVIQVKDLSKQYRLGKIGTGSIGHDLNRWWHSIRGKEDPYLKIGDSNDRTQKGNSEYVWALQDINFDVKQGEVLGIIGRNGAGKSTLLKILSKTTAPTTGSIKLNGRIASLLEVGTGFHPELSGKENVFLNGAILGMTKKEIARKFDEIVDFAGVERYIDTPVKRYSSGMYVRLAFGVAAHLESEILIVDEVLAVGDAEFQKKALGKMQDVSKGSGRTVLFVSHNMGAMRKLCQRGIYLTNGRINKVGEIGEVISHYLSKNSSTNLSRSIEPNLDIPVCVTGVRLMHSGSDSLIDVKEEIRISIEYAVYMPQKKYSIAVRLKKDEVIISQNFVQVSGSHIIDNATGKYQATTVNFPVGLLKAGRYSVDITCGILRTAPAQIIEDALSFELDMLSGSEYESVYSSSRPGVIALDLQWSNIKI